MQKSNSILKNSSILILGNLAQRIFSFFTIILISRFLGPAGYGQYSFVISFITIAAVFWGFGLNTVLVLNIAAERSKAATLMGEAILLKGILFTTFLLVMLFLAKWSWYSSEVVLACFIFAIGTFISSISEVFKTVFSAFRRMDFSAMLNVVRSLVVLIGIVIISRFAKEYRLVLVFTSYLLGFIFVYIFAFMILRRNFVIPIFSTSKDKIRKLFFEAKPFVLISAADIILFRVDHLMLSWISGDVELGLYGAAYTLFEIIISLLPMIIMGAAFPVLSDKFKNDLLGFKKLCNTILKIFFYFGIPMSCGLVLLGRDICNVVYGQDYVASGGLLSILGFSIWIFFFSSFLGWALTAMRLQKYVMSATVIALVLNIVGNSFAIPLLNGKGAAIVTVCCELIKVIYLLFCFKKNIVIDYSLRLLNIFFSSAIMSLLVFLMTVIFDWQNLILKLVVAVVVGIISFGITTLPFKLITRQEIYLIRES